jgi:Rps23 Pro-64 3,4-dihydroxylase Tpa1-like proline 4-hydroxylase
MAEIKEELVKKALSRIRDEKDRLKIEYRNMGDEVAKAIFIDGLLPDDLVVRCYNELESCDNWCKTSDHRESKSVNQNIDQVGILSAAMLDLFHDPRVIKEIAEITSIDGLEADPSLYAGGISKMEKGNFLNPHIDNSHNRDRTMYRRLNLLFYVTPGLTIDDGAALNLWDSKVKISKEICSTFNRLVVMETDKHTWHSVTPMKSDKSRFCLSNYYFSSESAYGENYYHVTSFTGRPEQKFIRLTSEIDNLARQMVAKLFGGRGSRRGRQT